MLHYCPTVPSAKYAGLPSMAVCVIVLHVRLLEASPLLRLQNPPLSPVLRRRGERGKKGVDDGSEIIESSVQPVEESRTVTKIVVTFESLPPLRGGLE